MTENNSKNPSFEDTINELENIVNELEDGELSLEESMSLFERGLALSHASQKTLSKAEQKIQILLNKNGEEHLVNVENTELDPS